MHRHIIKHALFNALGTALYIIAVVSGLFYAPKIFGEEEPATIFIPILMLCLFVFSAALTGFLVFGRPVLWYLDGKKQEALALLSWTLGMFFAVIVIVFILALLLGRL